MKRDLPKRVYRKHGALYYVTPANEWKRLCAERDGLPAMYRALAELTDSEVTSERMPAVISRWLESKRADLAPKTFADLERIAGVMGASLVEFSPRQMTTAACDEYLEAFALTPRTYNLHRTALKQVLAYAARKGLRDGSNPIADIPTKECAGRHRVVTDAEIAAVKKAALQAARNGAALVQMIDLALLTGQRISDVIGLRWQDVTADGLYFDQGKGQGRTKLLVEWTPKLRAAIKRCERGDRIGHVLKTQSGRGYRYSGIRSAWVRACERAGVEDLNIHDLRGRAGVDALGAGEDVRQAQRLLGHKGEAMTRHYVEGKYAKRVKANG